MYSFLFALAAIKIVLCMPCAAVNQEPLKQEQEISFSNRDVNLAGTLILPGTKEPYPAIVFLHGSGPATRSVAKPYAERFIEIGYASLIFDKRGSGSSTGSWAESSLKDLASDAVQAIQFLKSRKEIDPNRIGIWGVSQSGWVAALASTLTNDISFMIIVSGGGTTPFETEMYVYRSALNRMGLSAAEESEAMALLNDYFSYLRTGEKRDDLVAKIEVARKKKWYEALHLDRIVPSKENQPNWQWVATFDPVPCIEQIKFPVLLLFGGKDPYLPTDLAVEKWRKALQKAGNKHFTIKVFPGAGHVIQMGGHDQSGDAFAQGYFELMLNWLQDRFNVSPGLLL